MEKRMHFSEKMSKENSAANQESNGEMFVRRVASSGLVLKFKVDKYGTLPAKHAVSFQEVLMSGRKQTVREPLDNLESNCSPNAMPLLEQSEISTTEAGSNKISPFDNAKVAPSDEMINTADMVKQCTTMLAKQIVSPGTVAVDSSNGVSRMKESKTSFSEKANKHLVTENGGNNGGVVLHTCNECGKSFKEISSLHGHTGIHRREEYKRMRIMAEQQPMAVGVSHLVSSPITQETKKDVMKKIRLAARAKYLVTENGGSNGGVVLHTCNECGKSFKEISSLHGHTGIHRREEYKRMRIMAEQQPMAVGVSHVVSSPITQETKKDAMKKIRLGVWDQLMLSKKLKSHQSGELSVSMACSNEHITEVEETDEMREVSEILATLAQSFCKDSTVHVPLSASTVDCFVCKTCKRTFSSYQGLGGHMSIHNNKPNMKDLIEDGAGAGSSSGGGEQCTWKHVCGKCNEKFSSGKSLSGHKRKHCWEEQEMTLLLEDGNVKPPLQTASDAVQLPQEPTSLGNEIELPMPSSVSDEDVA